MYYGIKYFRLSAAPAVIEILSPVSHQVNQSTGSNGFDAFNFAPLRNPSAIIEFPRRIVIIKVSINFNKTP